MKPVISLLIVATYLIPLQSRAEDAPPLDGHWFEMLNVPGYSAYYGKSDAIHISPFIIWIWNKIEFKAMQQSSSGNYQSEIVKIVFRCGSHDATILRDIRYAADGSVVSDITFADKDAKYFDVNSKSKVDSHHAIIREIAQTDYQAACLKGD